MGKPKPLPKVLSQAMAKALLASNGWVPTIGGKHVVKMEKEGCRPITLPHHKGRDYGPDLTAAILRQAGLKKNTDSARGERMQVDVTYIVKVHKEDGYWAEVQELPGCFASGDTMEELWEALADAISVYLSAPGSPIEARMTEVCWRPEHKNEYRVLVTQ